MDLLTQLYTDFKDLELLLQIVIIGGFIWGILSGVIKLPFIQVRLNKSKKCLRDRCDTVSKHVRLYALDTHIIIGEQNYNAKVICLDIVMKTIAVYSRLSKSRKDIKIYTKCIKILDHKILETLEIFFRKNGYASMSDREFKTYKEDIKERLINIVGMSLDEDQELFSVPRDKILEANRIELIPYANEKFGDILDQAREVSVKYDKEKKAILAELEQK